MRELPGNDLPSQVSSSSDEIVTQVVGIKNVSAAELVPILRPMIPQQGHLAAYPPSNILIITDHASNVHRMLAIISRIDQTGNQDIDVMPLQNASASDVVHTIDTINQGQGNIQEGRSAAKVVADDRTNSVLIGGDPSQRLQIRALVAELDTPLKSGGNTQVVYLHYTDASKLAPKLKEQMSELAQMSAAAGGGAADTGGKNPQAAADKNALVWADSQNNALIITAPPKVMRTILDIVTALDRRRPEVLVQAIIAELDVSKTDDLGVNWAAFSKNDKVPLGGYVQPVGGTSLVDLVAAGESGLGGLSDSLLAGHYHRGRHAHRRRRVLRGHGACPAGRHHHQYHGHPVRRHPEQSGGDAQGRRRGAVRHRSVLDAHHHDHRRGHALPDRAAGRGRHHPQGDTDDLGRGQRSDAENLRGELELGRHHDHDSRGTGDGQAQHRHQRTHRERRRRGARRVDPEPAEPRQQRCAAARRTSRCSATSSRRATIPRHATT